MGDVRKLLVKKEKKEFIKGLEREVTVSKEKVYYITDLSKDFHTDYGVIAVKDLKKKDGTTILTNMKKEFVIFSSHFIDDYRRIGRMAQIIPLKDIGAILAYTGINKNSKVVDAGAGSGALACALAHICKEVTTYEIRDDFLNIVKKNKEFLGLKNLKIKKKDIYKGIDEKDVDLVTLDLPSPWNAIQPAEKVLRVGGFLVSYSPTITQATDFVNEISKHGKFLYMMTIEVNERSWEIEGRKVRPKSYVMHSGFISFARKIK
jgi:tRNA (adenine57-N1/adenine58-N1)-methyltransferase